MYEVPNQNDVGFGMGKGGDTYNIAGHTPLKALINLIYNLFVFSLHLFGWPLLSLVFILVPFIKFSSLCHSAPPLCHSAPSLCHSERSEESHQNARVFSIVFIICSIIAVSFFWFHGISPEGAKYYYELTPFLVLLTVSGIEKFKFNAKPLITLLFLIDIFIYMPQATKIFNVWGGNLYCYNEVKKQNLHNAIVFVRRTPTCSVGREEKDEITKSLNMHLYPSLSVRNDVDIGKSDIIYAYDLGQEQNIKLKKLYPTRKSYIFEYLERGRSYHLIPDY